jgi:hypothetical protein
MMKPFELKINIYHTDLVVALGSELNDVYKVLKGKISKADFKELKTYEFHEGKSIMFGSGACLLYTKEEPTNKNYKGILAHEIFHITEFIMSRIGIILTNETSEAYAYLIGHLTTEIYDKSKMH